MGSRPVDAAGQAYERLVRLIELRQLSPSRRLPSASAISEEIGLSRPLVLEALGRLAAEGRVAVGQGAGGIWILGGETEGRAQRRAWARDNADTIVEMAVLRRILEPGVARYVAENGITPEERLEGRSLLAQMRAAAHHERELKVTLDSRFHLLLASATRLPAVGEQLERARSWVLPMFEFVDWPDGREHQSVDDHAELFDAIETGDGERAEATMVRHVALSVGLIRSALSELTAELGAPQEEPA